MKRFFVVCSVLFLTHALVTSAAVTTPRAAVGDEQLAKWLETETDQLAKNCLANIPNLEAWTSQRDRYRQQLLEMLGLDPLPERTDLQPIVTGKVEHELFTVEKLHFQSSPQLYVTANLYLPKQLSSPAPTILYLCGHGPVIKDGVSYGNKVAYQHHGAWFARNGYVCLLIDTLQLGEIQGLHHGTHREGMWWWNARGYTPAGVEAWNSLRALDYLSTRPEVDTNRFGVTGRSGGGAYSWWIAAIDDRVKVAAPVAGMTDLRNHVIDGAVEGHCDCMFTVNTYRWDYAQVAALVAPRPLLLINTDSDSIFPLDGVMRIQQRVRRIYDLYNATDKFGLVIAPGPHKDTQDLQVPAFRWFNKHLKNDDPVIAMAATKFFEPEQLRVFASLPTDERNTRIHETFVPAAPTPEMPATTEEWASYTEKCLAQLKQKAFAGWPVATAALDVRSRSSFMDSEKKYEFKSHRFVSQAGLAFDVYVGVPRNNTRTQRVTLQLLDESGWTNFMTGFHHGDVQFNGQTRGQIVGSAEQPSSAEGTAQFSAILRQLEATPGIVAWFSPRGAGSAPILPDARKRVQVRRRAMLLGQTLDSMQAWDIRRCIEAFQTLPTTRNAPLWIKAEGNMAANALYASLFVTTPIARLDLSNLPASHRDGPDYLNVLKILDIPQAVALAAQRSEVHLHQTNKEPWSYPLEVKTRLKWNESQFVVESGGGLGR